MFSKSALVLALAAALRVSADAASDKAAEADLVGKLRLAPVATDRIALLGTDDEFAFDFFDPAAGATVGKGGKIVTANAGTFPAVIGTGSAMAVGFLDACSMNTPHMHPRATEMQISVNSTIRTGMITENGARFIMTELPPGSMTIFPMGSIHFQVNDGCDPALFVASFNSEDPGALQVAQRFLGLPPDIVGATLGDIGVQEIEGLESQIPDNVAIGTDACLKRCGLTRPPQPTLQRQSRVPGNAFSSSYSYTATATATATYNSESTYTTPAAQSWTTATATMTHGTSTWTTVYTSYEGTPSPTYAPSPVRHVIKVGSDGLYFTPSNISAAIGDIVTFEFHPKNHTVTQSSFLNPCKPLAQTSTTGEVGFKSGFVPVSATETMFPTFNITINDTAPIWGYCGQQGPPVHCTAGMVFSINAVESGPNNFAAFQQIARNSGNASSVSATYTQKPYSTPAPQSWATATATVTQGTSKWTTVYTSYAGSSAPTYAPSPVRHVIQVGADGLNFTPSNISASIGDIVTFEFHPKNHTVTQSSFMNPCKPLAQTSTTGQVGFKSGFVPVSATETMFPTFNITINDTAPIWGYCGQQGPPVHCTEGMVFSINAVESGPNNFAAFQQIARNSGSSSASASTSPTAAAAMDNSANKNLAAAGSDSSSEGSNKPSPAIIALLAINGVLVVGLIVLGGLYFRKRRAAARVNRSKQLYTSISASGDPIFVAPEKHYDDSTGAGDDTPLTHGLSHGPYYDPHEPGSRPPSRPASRLR
ncbi:RmlC-like cupin [Mycena latifolia]|nr:RmlC-like cupin [Mycena latifolia]